MERKSNVFLETEAIGKLMCMPVSDILTFLISAVVIWYT